MPFHRLVNRTFRNRLVASLLTSCENSVKSTCQKDFSQQACSKLVNKLCMTMLFHQLVKKTFRNRLVASLLTSCDHSVPSTCQQDFSQQACSKLVNKLRRFRSIKMNKAVASICWKEGEMQAEYLSLL